MIYQLGEQKLETADDDFFIAETASVIGSVRLGRGASIWWGATLRGDNDWINVGDRSNIQDGSVVHTDAGIEVNIGSGVTVGHMVMLHGCTIGNDSLVGIGSIILNNARIGENSLVGANTLITEGKEFPPGVMILGAPGKVVRELKPEEIEGLKRSAAHYVDNGRRYRIDLSRVG